MNLKLDDFKTKCMLPRKHYLREILSSATVAVNAIFITLFTLFKVVFINRAVTIILS